MASGISAQKSKLEIGTGTGAAKNITGVQIGNPTIITIAAHGFSNGFAVDLAGIVGTIGADLNSTKRVVSNVTANTFAIDFDSSGKPYTSGGTATPAVYTKINGINSYDGFDGQADDIDTTDLDSDAKEYIGGLRDEGKFGFEAKRLRTDPGQIALRANMVSGTVVPMRLTISDGTVVSFSVLVKTMPIGGAVNSVLKGKIDCKISGAIAVV
jgi:hypothetical protein